MYRFNQQKINSVEGESREPGPNTNCYGFTLIELLTAIAIIAILIGLLLPAIQKKREEFAKDKATQNITALMLASNEYFRRMGSYPNSISELFQFCSANPGSCSLDPQLATGRAGGYFYLDADSDGDSDGADFLLWIAEPEHPGITGSYTLTIGPDVIVNSTPTPGADAARQQAFDNILASGAATVVQLLNLDPSGAATSQVRGYVGATTVNAGTLATVFTTLDTNHDGTVSVSEVNATDNTLGSFSPNLKGFLDTVTRELRLDSLSDQDSQAIFVAAADVDGNDFLLFSYDGLADLTRVLVDGPILLQLTAKLDAAEAAEGSGNLNRKAKSLTQYRKLVKAQIGTSLTRANANILLTISTTL